VEGAAEDRLNAERGKEIAARHGGVHDHGFALSEECDVVDGGKGIGGDLLEAVGLVAPVADVGRGDLELGDGGVGLPDLDELVGLVKGEGAKDDGVDHAEESGVGADAECDGENSGEGEHGSPQEETDGRPHGYRISGGNAAPGEGGSAI